MKYTVYVSKLSYGVVEVEARNEEEAFSKVPGLSVDYFDEEITDMTAGAVSADIRHEVAEQRVETPLGAIIVRAATDPAHPGVWVDLRRPDADCDAPLALVEFSGDEGDHEEPSIITRVWGDVCEEDYSKRIIHQNIEKYFSTEEVGGNLYGEH